LFHDLDAARAAGNSVEEQRIVNAIDNYETHVVPIVADIDACTLNPLCGFCQLWRRNPLC